VRSDLKTPQDSSRLLKTPQDSSRLLKTLPKTLRQCDLFFALGSSLVVEPAASLPRLAHASGARLVIINRDPTGQDELADAVLHESLGSSLRAIDECLSDA